MAKKLTAAGPKEKAEPIKLTAAPKRGPKAKAIEPPRTYTAAQKDEARERCEIAADELGAIQGQLRNKAGQLKKHIAECAKVAGVSTAAIRRALAMRKRDVAEIDNETKETTRAAHFFKVKIGTQLGLFDDGAGKKRSVGDQVERDNNAKAGGEGKPSSATSIAAAKKAGGLAGKLGKGFSHNFPPGSPEALAWEASYRTEQEALAAKLGKGGANVVAASEGAAAH